MAIIAKLLKMKIQKITSDHSIESKDNIFISSKEIYTNIRARIQVLIQENPSLSWQ